MTVQPGNSQPYNLLPSVNEPVVDGNGILTVAWLQFFAQLVGQPQAIAAVPLTGSPLSYTASQKGSLNISGGTISAISINRARVTVATAERGIIPLAQGDTVNITYSAAPTLSFIPG